VNFIEQKEIFDKTNGGRDVIELYYQDSHQSFNNPHRKFKIRDKEKTASASVKKLQDGTWVVTDFGGDQKPRNCIQIVMLEDNCTFLEAINTIANKFNILPEEKKAELYKPEVTNRDANPEEMDGTWLFEYQKEFTAEQVLSIIAPKAFEFILRQVPGKITGESERYEAAIQEIISIFKKYSFYPLQSYTIIKQRKATIISATPNYPIFIFDQTDWKKIYQPKSMDAGRRFIHYGGRPANFIFGEKQARKAYDEVVNISDDEDQEEEAPKKKKKPQRLKYLIMCSGGSDGLNLACIGQCFKGKEPAFISEQYFPVWMNSETAKLSAGQHKSLAMMTDTFYNLPDIDHTGKRAAHELALEYLEIHTLYLPEELKEKRDGFRNKQCKDLRDYFRFYTVWDFQKLFKTAYPYRFWDTEPRFNKQGEYLKSVYVVNNKFMYNFLHRNGFYRYQTETEKDGYFYIQVQKNVVKKIEPKRIRDFINEFIEKRFPEVELMNTFLRTTQLNESSLSNLPFIEIDFTDFDRDTQWIFFKNKTTKITAAGIEDFRPDSVEKYVWEEEVIPHRFEKLDPFFEIKNENEEWDIEIKNTDCLVFRYLINASRIYWREELEYRLDGIPEGEREQYIAKHQLTKADEPLMAGLKKAEAEKYRLDHKFSIAGPLLTAREKQEQKNHLINKIFSIGFAFHRYKEASKAWAIWNMDAKISEGDESHGGSGKSLIQNLINENKLMKAEYREGRNPKLTDNPHIYEGITKHTDLVIVDDCHRYIKFDFFFGAITGPIAVNPKNAKQYTVPFAESPKFWFSSNYAVQNIDPSKERRVLYCMFSDYYHYSKMGEYREERRVFDDFGKNLGSDFNEDEWNLFLNFICQCVNFYLSAPRKINPPMQNINKRNLMALMGDAFPAWADTYFSEESGNLNTLVVKADALNDFLKTTKQQWTTQKFTSAMKAWCQYNNYELDPKEFKTAESGRIIRKVDVLEDGKTVQKSKEMIYVRTAAEAAKLTMNKLGGAETAPAEKDEDAPW
jgi:hypothetical protein